MANKKKQPETRTFNLWCFKCKESFTADLAVKDENVGVTATPLQKKIFCMKCGGECKVQGMADGVSIQTKTKKSHQNEAMSIEAMRMANTMKRADADAGGGMTTVISNQPGKNRGKPMQIPKQVIKSIEEKVVQATK